MCACHVQFYSMEIIGGVCWQVSPIRGSAEGGDGTSVVVVALSVGRDAFRDASVGLGGRGVWGVGVLFGWGACADA